MYYKISPWEGKEMMVSAKKKTRLYLALTRVAGSRPPAEFSDYESIGDIPKEKLEQLLAWAKNNSRLHWVLPTDLLQAAATLATSNSAEVA
jgi:hypothetical protein